MFSSPVTAHGVVVATPSPIRGIGVNPLEKISLSMREALKQREQASTFSKVSNQSSKEPF